MTLTYLVVYPKVQPFASYRLADSQMLALVSRNLNSHCSLPRSFREPRPASAEESRLRLDAKTHRMTATQMVAGHHRDWSCAVIGTESLDIVGVSPCWFWVLGLLNGLSALITHHCCKVGARSWIDACAAYYLPEGPHGET